jgi:hypothetical protein
MRTLGIGTVLWLAASAVGSAADPPDALADGFLRPPDEARPRVYWCGSTTW